MSTWREKPTSPDDLRAAIESHRTTPDRSEPITPRVRVNVKQLANGKWQPDITVESFDADPLTIDGQQRIYMRLREMKLLVAQVINQWEHPDEPEAPVPK